MKPTTPLTVTGEVRAFCRQISNGTAQYLPYTDYGLAAGYCHYNVAFLCEKFGGSVLFGWMIWIMKTTYRGIKIDCQDAEFHSVWQTATGELIDPTPRSDGEATILFLPDTKRQYDFETQSHYANKLNHLKRSNGTSRMEDRIITRDISITGLNQIRATLGLHPIIGITNFPFSNRINES